MENKKLGLGSFSLLLVIIALVWAYEIFGVCVGDNILEMLHIPSWSNSADASGTHYTVFYAFAFLLPAIFLSMKYKNNLFAKIGKWLSIVFATLLVLALFCMAI